MINIVSEITDSFNFKATRNDIVLIDTVNTIIMAKLNFTYSTPITIKPVISLQLAPSAPVVIR